MISQKEAAAAVLAVEGVKFDQGKARFDLIPPAALEQVAMTFTIGAAKYDDRNWEKGMSWGRVFAALMRHLWAWWRGEKCDPADGQHHLAAAAWGCLVLLEYERTGAGQDSRSKLTSIAQEMKG